MSLRHRASRHPESKKAKILPEGRIIPRVKRLSIESPDVHSMRGRRPLITLEPVRIETDPVSFVPGSEANMERSEQPPHSCDHDSSLRCGSRAADTLHRVGTITLFCTNDCLISAFGRRSPWQRYRDRPGRRDRARRNDKTNPMLIWIKYIDRPAEILDSQPLEQSSKTKPMLRYDECIDRPARASRRRSRRQIDKTKPTFIVSSQ